MSFHVNEILSGFFVINLAIALGAGVYEYRIVLPMWFGSSGIDRLAIEKTDTGRRFWGMVTTVPLTLLTFANLYLALRSEGELQAWWLSACFLILIERTGTFGYFIPTIIKLMRPGKLSETKAMKTAMQWKHLNVIRISLNLAGMIAALIAYTISVSQLN